MGEIKCVIPIIFKHLDMLDSDAPRGGIIPVIDNLFVSSDNPNFSSALTDAIDFILSSMAFSFERPIYFGMSNESHNNLAVEVTNVSTIGTMDCGYIVSEIDIVDKMLTTNYKLSRNAGKISYIIGKWSVGEHGIHSVDEINLYREATSTVKSESSLKEYELYDIGDLDAFRADCIEFANFVSKEFGEGHRGRDRVTKKGLGLELVDLPTASIIIPPKSDLCGTIPLHIKKQIDGGRQKPIRVSVNNVVSKRDVAILVYLIGKGKRTIKCYRELKPTNEVIKVPQVTKFKLHKKVNVPIEELTFPKGTDFNMKFTNSVKCLAEIRTIGINSDGVICKKDVPYALYLKSQGATKLSCYCN